MQRRSFLLQIYFDNFLGIVPGAACVGHKDSLVQAEDRDGDQISNEVKRLNKSKCQRCKKDRKKDIEHALLRILRAYLHNLLAVGNRGFLDPFKPNVGFDELDRAVGAGGHSLG